MMVALLPYAYSLGVRSARGIERRCSEDVAFRVITANPVRDHATIARFRARHEQAISELFSGVLSLCARAGLVKVGIVAVDGTKIAAAATHHANRSYEQIGKEIVELEAERAAKAKRVPRDRGERLSECKPRLEQDWRLERRVVAEHAALARAGGSRVTARGGWPARGRTSRHNPLSEQPAGKVNVTDPDSRNLKTTRGWVQGYNAQAAVTPEQIVVAAQISTESLDTANLEPMVNTAGEELRSAGVSAKPGVILADAGY